MKKFLILVLVLGMTSMAGAALQISVNGNPEPVDSEIIIAPSDELILDIWTNTAIALGGSGEYILVVDTSLGEISGGHGTFVSPPDPEGWSSDVQGETEDFPAVIPPEGMEGIFGTYANFDFTTFQAIPAGTVIADGIVFHCEGVGDAVIYLMVAADGVPSTEVLDTVIIHQIPEPATIALFGLGGLLLRRRK